MYRNYIKRLIDFFLAFVILIIFAPVFFLVSFFLIFQNSGKPFFLQARPGKNHRTFYIIKFKTMNDKKGSNGNLLPDVERITPLGAFLRKLSIDELPQLINVLKGEMSLIGPRPLLHKYLPLYSNKQDRRHSIKPGITGWAQVNGRNSITWTKKFELDIYYVDNLSFLLDLKIFYLTIKKVLKSEGINQTSKRPMQPFKGDN